MGAGIVGVVTDLLTRPTSDCLLVEDLQYSPPTWLELLYQHTTKAVDAGKRVYDLYIHCTCSIGYRCFFKSVNKKLFWGAFQVDACSTLICINGSTLVMM